MSNKENCLFCKIIAGEIKADIVYEDDDILAFKDIAAQAPIHILIIPKKHIATINDADDALLMGNIILVAKKLANKFGIDKSGYRLVINCNEDGGQTVYHIHCHLLGQRLLAWPPG